MDFPTKININGALCGDSGLTAPIFRRDLNKVDNDAAALRDSEIQINGVKFDVDQPHGGIGQSGIGHDCSALALHDHIVAKRITHAVDHPNFRGLNA